jgi:SpoIIAA-like
VDGVVRRCGRARLLVEYGDVDQTRVEPKSMWVSLRTARLLGDVDRVAVICDARWIEKLAEIAGPVTDVEVESFVNARHDEAVAWLRD